MRFDAVPTVRVNGVKFGMNREKVRSLLGAATEFYKFDDDINTTDDFGFCHVFYLQKKAITMMRHNASSN